MDSERPLSRIAAGAFGEGIPECGEADPAALQYLGQRRALVSPLPAGGLRGGQVERRLGVADRGHLEPRFCAMELRNSSAETIRSLR